MTTYAVVAVSCLASFAAARGRIGSRDRLWDRALEVDAGNESAATSVADRLRAGGDARGAYAVLAACAKARGSCRCAEAAASDAIDVGLYPDARALVDAADGCPRTPHRVGLIAESLIGTNALDEGLRQAEVALARDASDAHAAYARAWGSMLKGDAADARRFAEQAVALKRGLPAHLLLGLILMQADDLDAAVPQFDAALELDPLSAAATYDLALVAHRRGDYRAAREGYLKTLRLDPKLVDARYNLIVLTRASGATSEAQHHLDELVAAFPQDRRIPALRAELSPEPPYSTEDLVIGKGREAKIGDRASIHYVGSILTTGKELDSSRARGQPFELTVGTGRVIKGWDQGIIGMHVGGTRKVVVPSSLGYGDPGAPPLIPPKSTLVFVIELLAINK
jgi:tetratricopeptide (TPR) repeat protein